MLNSIALDKIRKPGTRASIFVFDLLRESDRDFLMQWLNSKQLCWVHMAPVCGTASRARDIPRKGAPKPLRSSEFPLGFEWLEGQDRERVAAANQLFEFSCRIFALCVQKGILVTMENPRSSYFWITLLELMTRCRLSCSDFQVCMLGSSRDKWTRILASFEKRSPSSTLSATRNTPMPLGARLWTTKAA